MKPLNLLITNYCNQKCSFCFASSEMGNKRIRKEMPFDDIINLIRAVKNKNPGMDTIKLLGGEPTLHHKIKDILEFSLDNFENVQIFTNGIFPKNIDRYFYSLFPRLKITFNIMTPSYLLNPSVRELISSRVLSFGEKTDITLSLTIDPFTNVIRLIKLIPLTILTSVKFYRIGIANPIADQKNYYHLSDFPNFGSNLVLLTSMILKHNSKTEFSLNCGLTQCMFSATQYQILLKNNVNFQGWGCFGKSGSMDINPDLEAFHCFPLSSKIRSTKRPDIADANFQRKRYDLWKKYELDICIKCPFYGHTPDKCPGPCIAFRMNDKFLI